MQDTFDMLEALARAAGSMENPKFDSTNPHFRSKFASLAACEAVVRPKLAEQGLMYSQTCEVDHHGLSWLVTSAYGRGGSVEMSRVPLVMVQNDPQKQGSALTYAKRYGLCAAFGLAGEEDDDGNAASEPQKAPQRPKQRPTTPQRAEERPASDIPPLSPENMATLRESFVAYRDALGLDGSDALSKLLDDTGIANFGEHMTEQDFQIAQIAMGKAIAKANGAKASDG